MYKPHSSMFRRAVHAWLAMAILLFPFWFMGLTAVRATGLVFSSVRISGTNLVVSGSGGVAGATYYLMTSTNLALSPVALWNRVSTNVFSAGGLFTNSNPMNPLWPQEFFVLTTNMPVTIPGLVAAYSFDEGSGTTVYDASGNGNNGAVGGATWTTSGKYGNALVFNGASTLLTVKNSTTLQLSNAMTLEAWVSPQLTAKQWTDIIMRYNDNYYLNGTSDKGPPAVGGTFYNSDTPLYLTQYLPLNTWTYLAATYDRTTLKFYTNGVLAASASDATSIATSSNPVYIGGDRFFGQFFDGTIDEVRVYKVALTAAQIQADMNTPVGDIPTAPGNVNATATGTNQVSLSWTASTGDLGVAGYFVERSQGVGSTNFVQIGAASSINYQDSGLVANTNYSYRVRATDSLGDLGPYSSVAVAFTGLALSPGVAVLTITRTQPFAVNFTNLGLITWSVDGVEGGSSSAGMITAMGLYTPPSSAGTHTVTATTSDQTQTVSATVYISTNPGIFTQHNDNLRTGQNQNETVLTPANVNSNSFGKLFSYPIDGISFASPLYVANVNIPGNGYHNLVFVVTENDSVYAFDADGLTNNPVWHVSFINPGAGITTVPSTDTSDLGDIPAEIGITGTPVIDPTTGTVYVVAKTKEVSGNVTNYVQRLHALDITTGAEKFGGPVAIQASVPGTAVGSKSGLVTFVPLIENQRPALLLNSNVVYIAFAAHGDYNSYNGFVLGYNATNLQQVMAYCTTPDNSHPGGGIWQGGNGIAADANGNLFFATGNGDFDANTGGVDYGDTIIQISPAGLVRDYFTPYNQLTLQQSDLDLGSAGVLLLPDQSGPHPHLLVQAGKTGSIYLVNRDNMGHYSANGDTNVLQVLPNALPGGNGGNGNRITPVYFNEKVYFSDDNDYIKAYQLTNGLLSSTPASQSSEQYNYPGAPLSISANGTTNGILWVVERFGDSDIDTGGDTFAPGVLRAYDATNLTNVLYDSNQAGLRDTLDYAAKFSEPRVANGKVFVASMSQLTVYGLLP